MRILIVTQTVDTKNQVLGFFYSWIKEFSKHFDFVTVVCLSRGEGDVPENVKVLSLGKESGVSKVGYLYRFYKYILRERKNYDAVFVHMNPIYVVLGGLLWRILGKRIGLWYVHKSVDLKLRVATLFSHTVFTASKESFRLESKKVRIVGHGIDTDKFKPLVHTSQNRIITTGRIARAKNIKPLISVFQVLNEMHKGYTLTIIGDAITLEDLRYKSEVLAMVKSLDLSKTVSFVGSLNQNELAEILPTFDIFINMSDTGSLDKAVLEAASCGLRIVTTNEAFKDIFPEGYINTKNSEAVAQKVVESNLVQVAFRDVVVQRFDLKQLVQKIKNFYE